MAPSCPAACPPAWQTSHRSRRAPARAGRGSPRERDSEKKPASLPVPSVRDKTTFRKEEISVERSGQPPAQRRSEEALLTLLLRGQAQWPRGRDQPHVPLPERAPLPVLTSMACPAPRGAAREPRPCGDGSGRVLGARCWPRAATKHWNEVAPLPLPREESPLPAERPGWRGDTRGVSSSPTETGRGRGAACRPVTAGMGHPGR